MFKWKKPLLYLLSLCLLLSCSALQIHATQATATTGANHQRNDGSSPISFPSVSAQSAYLMEADSGNTIYEKQSDLPLPMASTTKIMTALVALELCSPDTKITVDPVAVGVEGSSVYLEAGESLTLEQLLYALLLESANDAAVAIAVGLSGSVEAFAERMNQKAAQLELKNTHFTNPHGLDNEDHYTTAHELAIITRCAMEHSLFRTIVSTRKTTIPHATTDNVRLLVNHNKLLRLYEGCVGVKTGYTKRSGRCLVSAARRNGVTLIAVTVNAPDDWNDHIALLDYGFSKYESVLLCDAETHLFPMNVAGGAEAYVMVGNSAPLRVTLPVGHGAILCTIEAPRFAYAPIDKGDSLGKVVFRSDIDQDGNTEIIGEMPLTAYYTVPRQPTKKSFWQWLRSLFGWME